MPKKITGKRVVGISLIVSVSDVVLSFVVALLSGSVVLLSQSFQGLSDLTTAGILYLGVKRSARKADKKHPFGYGREIFFWVLVAGVLMFLGTGGLSFYFGYRQFVNPGIIDNVPIALGMLVFGLATNFYAFSQSLLRLNQTEGRDRWWRRFLRSDMVETKATFLIDFLGTGSAALGLVAFLVYWLSGDVRFDGLGSMLIGLLMMSASMVLIADVRSLIVGRSVPDEIVIRIRKAALKAAEVKEVLDLHTMYIGSSKLLVLLEVHLDDTLTTKDIEKILDTIKSSVKRSVPQAYHVQVEVETPDEEMDQSKA